MKNLFFKGYIVAHIAIEHYKFIVRDFGILSRFYSSQGGGGRCPAGPIFFQK
jgi:hypothetical protein